MSFVALSTLLVSSSLAAELETAVQYRPRLELRATDPTRSPAAGVGHRARAAFATGSEDLTVAFTLQDVRRWGEETNTLGDFDANGLDLHEGFLNWKVRDGLSFKVGRQEVSMHEHRLIGTVGWAQQARSFDAIRATGSMGTIHFDLVGAVLADHPGEEEADPHVYGDLEIARVGWTGSDSGQVDLLVIRDTSSAGQTDRTTAGVYAKGASGILSGRLEGYLQNNDGFAHMVGVRGTIKPETSGNPSLTLWLDRLSAATGDTPAFNTLFATNHKFYGTSDLAAFSLGGAADGRGLHDISLKTGISPAEGWRVLLDGHFFTTADSDLATLGKELDLTGKRTLTEGLDLALGASAFMYGDDTPENLWGWLQIDAKY